MNFKLLPFLVIQTLSLNLTCTSLSCVVNTFLATPSHLFNVVFWCNFQNIADFSTNKFAYINLCIIPFLHKKCLIKEALVLTDSVLSNKPNISTSFESTFMYIYVTFNLTLKLKWVTHVLSMFKVKNKGHCWQWNKGVNKEKNLYDQFYPQKNNSCTGKKKVYESFFNPWHSQTHQEKSISILHVPSLWLFGWYLV